MNKSKLLISTTLIAFTVLSFIVMPAMAKPLELKVIIKSAETHKGVPHIPIDIWGTKDGINYNWRIGFAITNPDGTFVFNTSLWEGLGYLTTIQVHADGQIVDCKLNPKYGGRVSITI